MINTAKVLSILICIFFIQTLGSCLLRCDDPRSYSVSYESIKVESLDTSGFNIKNSDSALFKNAFAIKIDLHTEEKEVSDYRIATSIGFNSAYAIEKCEDAYYIYEDTFADIILTRIDENGDETIVTNDFSGTDYDGSSLTIAQIVIKQNNDYSYPYIRPDAFNLELQNYRNLPRKIKLRVDVVLESATILTYETDTLYFVN